MINIKVEKLSDESFRKFGVYQDLTNDEQMSARTVAGGDFKADLIELNFGKTTLPTVSVCTVYKKDQRVVDFMEYHQFTCEGLFPFDDDVVIYVGTTMNGKLDAKDLHAFYVPKYTFVKLNPLVVHGGQFPVHNEKAHLICMLPQRTYNNDMHYRIVDNDDEKGLIVD